ncbi:TetR/AcrR family transcriptional regulator [Actinopolymorpha sp. B17G11]|uniref:TetR/AcrR family transcriptional regulator n=1 Tax=unclassified Actinopolymorpha TaxID=2627063 RepID=UPI0032D8EB98
MADDPSARAGATPSRRRGTALEAAILHAAAQELAEAGYVGLTMDRVAKRAGTNKNAIYRRWPNRAALGVAAYRHLAIDRLELPDTGELRADVLELMRGANRHWSSPLGEILRGLLSHVGDDPAVRRELQDRFSDGGSAIWLTVLGRAVARGEAAPEVLHPRVATVAVVLLRNEFVTRGVTTVPDDVLVEIVDEVYLPLVRGRGRASAPE